MKKPIPPRRTGAGAQTDTSRIRQTRTNGTDPAKTAHPSLFGNRTISEKNAGSPALAPTTNSVAPQPTVALSRKPGSAELLELFGHKRSCAELSKSGLVASCDCKPGPMQDPAVAIGVVMHYARLGMAQRAPLPPLIVELLTHHVETGDPACIMVADWLDRSGLLGLPLPSLLRRRIR